MVPLREKPRARDGRPVERAIVSPFREHPVDGRVVDQRGPIVRSGDWHALPLHTRIEDPRISLKTRPSANPPIQLENAAKAPHHRDDRGLSKIHATGVSGHGAIGAILA